MTDAAAAVAALLPAMGEDEAAYAAGVAEACESATDLVESLSPLVAATCGMDDEAAKRKCRELANELGLEREAAAPAPKVGAVLAAAAARQQSAPSAPLAGGASPAAPPVAGAAPVAEPKATSGAPALPTPGVASGGARRTAPPSRSGASSSTTTAAGSASGATAPKAATGKKTSYKTAMAEALDDLDDLDDWSQPWREALEEAAARPDGEVIWGGYGRGGRGIGVRAQSKRNKDIWVEGVTLAYSGKELLERTTLRFMHGRRYGLIGANGVGKSTLLRRMARGTVPGFPMHLRVAYLHQEISGSEDKSVIDHVIELSTDLGMSGLRSALPKGVYAGDDAGSDDGGADAAAAIADATAEKERLEGMLETGEGDADEVAEQLCEVLDRLEAMGVGGDGGAAGGAGGDAGDDTSGSEASDEDDEKLRARAEAILRRMGFTSRMMAPGATTSQLSGGWLTRLALAGAMLSRPDVLLLDEPTNHLDLYGVLWLQDFLAGGGLAELGCHTLIVVSHDRAFLDAVVTDLVVMAGKQLHDFAGNLSAYAAAMADKEAHMDRLRDAKARKEKKIHEQVAAAKAALNSGKKAKKGKTDKRQKAAANKLKKVERLGFYSEDGKAYKTKSAKTMFTHDLPSELQDKETQKLMKFKFPTPDVRSLRLASADTPVMSLEDASVGYAADAGAGTAGARILSNVTVQVTMQSRIALVGANGCGKTTLLKTLVGELSPFGAVEAARRHRQLRVAHVAQHHIDALEAHLEDTPVEYLKARFSIASDLEVRAHLGAFGIAGDVALQRIADYSGGQKARLVFATVMWERPHVLVMDEPTNHLDTETQDALTDALKGFAGGVILVSHDQRFICDVCNELWVVEDGRVAVQRPALGGRSEGTFDELFAAHRNRILRELRSGGKKKVGSMRRRRGGKA